jgi:uncharacterized protein (DUF1697 family)
MPQLVAFLRAINVGGHTVPMSRLREIFASLKFANIETFIASGNVIFESSAKNPRALETKIARALHDALGYEVATFIRTDQELAEVADYAPFTPAEMASAAALNVAFFAEPLDASDKEKALALRTAIDDFHVHGRELYWRCAKKQSESKFSNVVLEKTLGKPCTFRGINTIKKLVAKYKF